jgi:DNA-binding beta-propeller fold protein YncE
MSLLSALMLPVLAAPAAAATFADAPMLPDEGIRSLDRTVARAALDRELFGEPYATAVVGHVDVYDGFPYLESRWFQIVSDPQWNRLLVGEVGGSLSAVDGAGTSFGALRQPRGLAADELGRVWVADAGNHRVLAFSTSTEFDRIDLVPLFAVNGLARPFDVAFSDGGTPFAEGDDRLYVADTGRNRVVAYDVTSAGAREAFSTGELGRGTGFFAGPLAIAVGRSDGASTPDVYVSDGHNGRIVRLADRGNRFDWLGEVAHAGVATSLDTDHWGAVYAASPETGAVTKYGADLTPVAELHSPSRPRAFHVPFVTRTDHRDGTVRRAGQGSGLLVEEWTGTSGIRLVKLGVEVKDLTVSARSEVAADFVVTDRASLTAQFVDPADGRVLAARDLGAMDAGRHHVAFAPADLAGVTTAEPVLRLSAASTYANGDPGRAEAAFTWTGSVAPAAAGLIAAEPNPFQAETSIRFAVPAGGERFALSVYDVTGRLVRVVDAGTAPAGVQVRSWDGRDGGGGSVGAGVYLMRLTVGREAFTRKVVRLR